MFATGSRRTLNPTYDAIQLTGKTMDIGDLMRHVPHLQRYARKLTGNGDLADDLVHDTLERALTRLTLFQSGTNLRAWLFAIMHNVLANQARKVSARAVHVSFDDYSESQGESFALSDDTRFASGLFAAHSGGDKLGKW